MKRLKYYSLTWLNILKNLHQPFIVFKLFYYHFLKINSRFIIHLHSGLSFEIRNLMDLWVVAETCLNQVYRIPVNDSNKMIIVDIGAAFGDYSIMMAKLYPKSRVYAFEPYSKSYQLLKTNIGINRLQNIIPSNLAVTQSGENVYFNSDTLLPGNSQTVNVSLSDTLKIKSISLGKFIDKIKKPIDILKIDCEGWEYPILLSLNKKQYNNIKNIVMEYHLFSKQHKKEFKKMVLKLKTVGFIVNYNRNVVHPYLGYLFASLKTFS